MALFFGTLLEHAGAVLSRSWNNKILLWFSALKTLSSDGFIAGHLQKVFLAHNKGRRKLAQVKFLKKFCFKKHL